ncbi:MAG: hypothetical protein COB37_03430 [Kordiimonadales bacterium]|nr:MAG: hypothetical protein COB37_03430 [Kordiimonadales bacterium]
MKNKTTMLLALPLALFAGACAPNLSSNSYDAYSVGEVRRVERGTIQSYRWVEINTRTGVGTVAGAGIGAAAGSTVGDGAGGVIGAIGGALLGGLIGSSIEKSANKRTGYEYVILTASGSLVSIVQADRAPLPEGSPVLIQFSGQRSRVIFDHNAIDEAAADRRSSGDGQGGY